MSSDAVEASRAAGTMPGWHVVANLTPPELIASRRLRKVRVWVVIGVLLVVAGAGGGYYYERGQADLAAQDLAAEQATTHSLLEKQRSFADLNALKSAISVIERNSATLMDSDVDVDSLVAEIVGALPDGMTISQANVTIPPTVAGANDRTEKSGVGALDTSADVHIGQVTLTGTGESMEQVPAFIEQLSAIDGIFDPFPTSNAADSVGITYSLQFALTSDLLTHRFETQGGS